MVDKGPENDTRIEVRFIQYMDGKSEVLMGYLSLDKNRGKRSTPLVPHSPAIERVPLYRLLTTLDPKLG